MGEIPLWKLKQEAREYIAKCDAEHGTVGLRMEKKICPVCHSDRVGTFPYLGRGDFAMCFDCGAQGQLSKPEEWKPFHEPETIDVISSDLWDKATRRADDGRT